MHNRIIPAGTGRESGPTGDCSIDKPSRAALPRALRRLAILALAMGAIAGTRAPAAAQAGTGRVQGRVVAAETGEPLAGVRVSLAGTAQGTVSDASGDWRLNGVAAGEQTLVLQAIGRAPLRLNAGVRAGSTVELNARLAPAALMVDSLVVTAERTFAFTRDVESASRLGLTVREIPATVNVITQGYMKRRGLRTVTEAYNAAPGVSAGNIPGSPATLSMRGITFGGNAYLMDGVRVTNSDFISRNWDTWNYESIEVLKGPASVLYGVGVLGGAVNLIPKRASFGNDHSEALLSAGSFGTYRVAAGANRAVSDQVAVRGDVGYSRSAGWVDRTGREQGQAKVDVLYQPVDALQLDLTADYARDDYGTAYFGQPLTAPGIARHPTDVVKARDGLVLDRALRRANYDVTDGLMDSESYWLRSRASYQPTPRLRIVNDLSRYGGDRHWSNAEDFSFNAQTGLLDRTTTRIDHDHQFWMERAYLNWDLRRGGLGHRLSAGFEHGQTDFFTPRRFGETTSVDPFAPVRGTFPADTRENFSTRVDFDTDLAETALFLEEAFDVTDRLLLVGGLRYDRIAVDRTVDDLNAGTQSRFDRTFTPLSWRVGAVVDVHASTQLFGQYTAAVTPVSSFLTLSQSRAEFDLSRGTSMEAGLKSSFLDDRVALTASVYRLRQSDILTRDPDDFALTVQGGEKSSTGAELAFYAGLTQRLRVDGNLAVLDARFDELLAGGGVDLRGNTPANVPERVANGNAWYVLPGLPVTLGANVTSAGGFYTDDANTIRVSGYTVWGASASHDSRWGTVTLRARNLADRFYAEWSGYSPTQIYVGEPRSVEISWTGRF